LIYYLSLIIIIVWGQKAKRESGQINEDRNEKIKEKDLEQRNRRINLSDKGTHIRRR